MTYSYTRTIAKRMLRLLEPGLYKIGWLDFTKTDEKGFTTDEMAHPKSIKTVLSSENRLTIKQKHIQIVEDMSFEIEESKDNFKFLHFRIVSDEYVGWISKLVSAKIGPYDKYFKPSTELEARKDAKNE